MLSWLFGVFAAACRAPIGLRQCDPAVRPNGPAAVQLGPGTPAAQSLPMCRRDTGSTTEPSDDFQQGGHHQQNAATVGDPASVAPTRLLERIPPYL